MIRLVGQRSMRSKTGEVTVGGGPIRVGLIVRIFVSPVNVHQSGSTTEEALNAKDLSKMSDF